MPDDDVNKTILHRFFDYVNVGVARDIQEVKSVCPPKKKKSKSLTEEQKDKSLLEPDVKETIPQPCPKEPYVPPSQICPKPDPPCCYIKMQDPESPCCCEVKTQLPPCPPKSHSRAQRESTCGCDYCKKTHVDRKCCEQSRFRDADASQFGRA